MAFSPGDIVQLKSGSAAMTVIAEADEGVRCTWYAEVAGEIRVAVVAAICLEIIELDDDEIYEVEELGEDDGEDEDVEVQPVLPLPPERKKRN